MSWSSEESSEIGMDELAAVADAADGGRLLGGAVASSMELGRSACEVRTEMGKKSCIVSASTAT
jgi:hypothetical protein